tara:strand:- start:1034 stop:1162 length:129 start_codon:yes stop_codon:yes gene_type:complete
MKKLKFKDRDIFNWNSDKDKESLQPFYMEINAATIQDGMITS